MSSKFYTNNFSIYQINTPVKWKYTYIFGTPDFHIILCLFWITILLEYIFPICDCNHNIAYHSWPTNKSFSVFWDKLKHQHNIAFITFLHTLRHYAMPHEYLPLATLLKYGKFFHRYVKWPTYCYYVALYIFALADIFCWANYFCIPF